MDCYYSDLTLFWGIVQVIFCSLNWIEFCCWNSVVWRQQGSVPLNHQVKGISWSYSILVSFLSVDSKEILLFLGRQNPALIHLQSLRIKWFIRKTGMSHIRWVYLPAGFQYLQLFPFGVYIDKNTQADNSPCSKALHGDRSVAELFIFLISTCGFPIAVVGLWRARGKVPQRSGEGFGSSSQLAPEWAGEIIEQMGWLFYHCPFLLRCLLKMTGRKLLCKKNDH